MDGRFHGGGGPQKPALVHLLSERALFVWSFIINNQRGHNILPAAQTAQDFWIIYPSCSQVTPDSPLQLQKTSPPPGFARPSLFIVGLIEIPLLLLLLLFSSHSNS